jgi:hypothetical protein
LKTGPGGLKHSKQIAMKLKIYIKIHNWIKHNLKFKNHMLTGIA